MGALTCKKLSVLGWPRYKVWVAFGWERNGKAHFQFYIYITQSKPSSVYHGQREINSD